MFTPQLVSLRVPRTVIYFITFALTIVSIGAGLNSLVQSKEQKDKAQNIRLPLGLAVHVNTDDIIRDGAIVIVGTVLIAIVSSFSLVALFVPRLGRIGVHIGVMGIWLFSLIWTFGSAIALLVVARNNSAAVSLGDQQLSPQLVDRLQGATGLNPEYWSHGYAQFFAIIPFPLIAFTAASTVLTFLAYRATMRETDDDERDFYAVRSKA